MDSTVGDEYELLDNATDAESRRPAHELPPLELGQLTQETPPVPPAPPASVWIRGWAVALAFVLGIVAGAYVWHVQQESAADAEAAHRADLFAATILGSVDSGRASQHIRVLLLNSGPRDVDVLDVRPRGWQARGTEPVVVPTDEWTVLRMIVEPNCSAPVPGDLVLEVRTGSGDREVILPIPPGGSVLDAVHDRICGIGARYAITTGRVTQLDSGDDSLLMNIDLRSVPPDVDFEIVGVAAATAGYVAEATNLPVAFHATRRSPSPLAVRWEVTACYLTELLGDITLQVQVMQADGETYPAQVALPGQAIALLARHAAETCD